MAPAFTIGLMVRSSPSSMAITELNGRPVLFTPSFARASWYPRASQTSAKTNGFDTLWMENSCVGLADLEHPPAGADDAGAEPVRRRTGERRDVVRDDTVADPR